MTRLVVIPSARFLPTQLTPIDILTGFTDSDYISCAFPDFDLVNIDPANSYIDITSNTTGNFDLGPTDSVSFDQSIVPLAQGNTEFRFSRRLLRTINKRALTGIRFRITVTTNTTFRVAAIRCLSQSWMWAPIDLDTLYHRAVYPVSPTANPNYPLEFPKDSSQNVWPILWRSDNPSGVLDPKPIDSRMSIYFYSGSLINTYRDTNLNQVSFNEVSLHFREASTSPLTQVDLNTMNQDALVALKHQPDFGNLIVGSRPQSSLDTKTQAGLDRQSQLNLEGEPISTNSASIRADLKWDNDGATFTLKDSLGNGYFWDNLTIEPDTYYLLMTYLVGTQMRVQLFPADYLGNVLFDNPLFDTRMINDPVTFKRRQGRVGWLTTFVDGDAYMQNVRVWQLNFAEYRSQKFRSNTPVRGAQLQVGGLLSRDLYNGIQAAPWGGIVTLDQTKSTSGQAIKVNNSLAIPLAGAITNKLYFDDWDDTTIFFNIFFPMASQQSPIIAFLLGENSRVIPLGLPQYSLDKWQNLKIKLKNYADKFQTGYYRIAWVQVTAVPTIWWLDQIHVQARMFSWAARAKSEDPWGMIPVSFTPFCDTVNADYGGVVFDRGTDFQIRAQARRQDARAASIKMRPQYATLGNFIWEENKPALTLPTASFTYSPSGLTLSFTDTSPNAIYHQWDFGDGALDLGMTPKHTYAAHGTYTVALEIVDALGGRGTTSQVITV